MADDDIIQGLDGLEEAIKELDYQTSEKALKNAMMFASKPMLDDMKASAPFDDSPERSNNKHKIGRVHLAETVKRRSVKANGDHAANIKVGVFSKAHAYWAAMLNYGTKYIMPMLWMNRVAERNVEGAIDRFATKLRKNLEKAKR